MDPKTVEAIEKVVVDRMIKGDYDWKDVEHLKELNGKNLIPKELFKTFPNVSYLPKNPKQGSNCLTVGLSLGCGCKRGVVLHR